MRFSKRIGEIVVIVLMGVAFGKFTVSIIDNFQSGNILASNLFSPFKLIDVFKADLLIWGLCVSALIWFLIFRKNSKLSIKPRKISNTLIYLHVFSLFITWGNCKLSFIPSAISVIIFLSCGLFLCLFFTSKYDHVVPRFVKLLLLFYFINLTFGIASSLIGLNIPRSYIPLWKQFTYSILVGDAVLVVYFLFRNNWGTREFEKMFSLILLGSSIIAVESILGFYLNIIPLSSPDAAHRFASWFIGRHHFSAGLGLFMFFISLYFYAINGKKHYWITAILGALLAFSSLSRQAMIAFFMGLVLYFFLNFRRNYRISIAKNALFSLSAIVALPLAIYFSVITATSYRPQFATINYGIWDRISITARGMDILLNHPLLGTGNGLSRFYFRSCEIPAKLTILIPNRYTNTIFWSQQMKTKDVFREGDLLSTHSLIAQVAVENGIPGLVFVIILMYCFIKNIFLLSRSCHIMPYVINWKAIFAIYALILSMIIYSLTTSKFEPMWYFGVLGSFGYFIHIKVKSLLQEMMLNAKSKNASC